MGFVAPSLSSALGCLSYLYIRFLLSAIPFFCDCVCPSCTYLFLHFSFTFYMFYISCCLCVRVFVCFELYPELHNILSRLPLLIFESLLKLLETCSGVYRPNFWKQRKWKLWSFRNSNENYLAKNSRVIAKYHCTETPLYSSVVGNDFLTCVAHRVLYLILWQCFVHRESGFATSFCNVNIDC